MAFQPVVDTVEIDIIYTLNGSTLQNTFYAALVGGYAQADLAVLAAGIDGQVNGTWLPHQPIEAFYSRTEVRGLAVENDITASNNTNAGVGVRASPSLPNNVTFAVKKESGFTGRSARGRCYWIGVPTSFLDSVNENFIDTAEASNIVAAIDSIRTQITALALWAPVLVSRFAGGEKRAAGLLFPWISSTSVDLRVDTQRGRLP